MPGHAILRKFFKDPEQFDRFSCVRCFLLMKDVVQPSCGHRLCQTCADDILQNDHPPLCPHKYCGEEFTDEDGANYFPDRFIRKEIQNLEVYCKFSSKGCAFEGKFSELEAHLTECKYASYESDYLCRKSMPSYECYLCEKSMALDQVKRHKAECENATQQCPLAKVGCLHDHPMSREVLSEHMSKNKIEHFTLLADQLHTLETTTKTSSPWRDLLEIQYQQCCFSHIGCRFRGTLEDLARHDKERAIYHNLLKKKAKKCTGHVKQSETHSHKLCTEQVVSELEEVTDYYGLGLRLKIPPFVLKRIEEDNPRNWRRLTEVIIYWLNNDPTASWKKLGNALEKIGHKVLAEQVRSKANIQQQKQHAFFERFKRGARKMWGAVRECTAETIWGFFSLLGIQLDGIEVRRKGKTDKKTGKFRWWFKVEGDESCLKKLDEASDAFEAQFQLRVEPVLSC